MLQCIDSRELAEWQAYEIVYGPIGHEWRDDVLAAIAERLHVQNYLFGKANFKESPIPEPEPVPRPGDRETA